MQHTVLKPPAAAARVPVSISSLYSCPGSRRCTCKSMRPGTTHRSLMSTIRGATSPRPISTMRPFVIRISAAWSTGRAAAGSNTRPPRRTRSTVSIGPGLTMPWYARDMPTAGIVIIGDEILSGKFAEENAAFLIGELRALGVDLRRITFVPDDLDDIAQTVLDCSRRFDYVFTSGGVGPTHDDITMAAIAQGFGTTIIRHPDLEARVRGYW